MASTKLPAPLWRFTDSDGTFRADNPDRVGRLYFPLCNEAGILSSITPDLHGDIKTGQNTFLTQPVSVDDLHNLKSSRNFWIHVEGREGAWSAAGVSAAQEAKKFSHPEKTALEAGLLWHRVTRENAEWNLRSEIVNFAPAAKDSVEIMLVTVTNTGKARVRVTPTAAVPIFGRSADNLRDHCHVTSLLQRVLPHASGVVVRPTMSFDERGHKLNETLYAVLGVEGDGAQPAGTFASAADFIGEGGSFEAPRAALENLEPPTGAQPAIQGKSTVGAVRFQTKWLAPGQKAQYVVLLGVTAKEADLGTWIESYGSVQKAEAALTASRAWWKERADRLKFGTLDSNFNGWVRWVGLQPLLRKIFGCSFLPDFDYGRGGRGWRDLWQDCLALLLTSPDETRPMLLHNFNGVRIDGSNATIIGSGGEFIADRNNITRVWMDHGVWPYITLELYIHQTGDFGILFENGTYFRDVQQSRAGRKDRSWSEAYGRKLKTRTGRVVEGTVLEHVLIQHLVQFYNVGEHNHIRLEGADWNDGLDMAHDRGESVAFTALYASNLRRIAVVLEDASKKSGVKKVLLAKELLPLLDRAGAKKTDYDSVSAKRKKLEAYFDAVEPEISGVKSSVPVSKLCADLRAKADWITGHIRKKEWIQERSGEGFFNGYYDNHGRRVEGNFKTGLHMTLAGQTFPIMGGVATLEQAREAFAAAKRHLKDAEHGGFRLNTDFGELRLDLGRAFSFIYGDKENGAFFSHMAVMFANALYQRGLVAEGEEVLFSLYKMAARSDRSKIYPGLPEYCNSEGRGLYLYLTGSASWYILTLLTQVYGVRGHYGDLLLSPKFTADFFRNGAEVSVDAHFAGRPIRVAYRNAKKISYDHAHLTKVTLNGKELKGLALGGKEVVIPKEIFLSSSRKADNTLVVTLE